MKHASDEGTLPANVEQQRTRVSVDQDAPRHTSTVEYAGAYYGSGVDNSFSMERFSRDFKIDIKSLDEEELVFDMIGIDPAIANAFRRILLSEVPTMAIEKVFILNNTSMIQDEMLSHRLGLVPIKADPRKFRERAAEEDADEHNVISFRLQVESPGACVTWSCNPLRHLVVQPLVCECCRSSARLTAARRRRAEAHSVRRQRAARRRRAAAARGRRGRSTRR